MVRSPKKLHEMMKPHENIIHRLKIKRLSNIHSRNLPESKKTILNKMRMQSFMMHALDIVGTFLDARIDVIKPYEGLCLI